jgi:hypothetical protein
MPNLQIEKSERQVRMFDFDIKKHKIFIAGFYIEIMIHIQNVLSRNNPSQNGLTQIVLSLKAPSQTAQITK